MASVTVPLTGVSVLPSYIRWVDNYSLGSLFSADGAEQILSLVDLNSDEPAGRVVISISGINNRFTPAFEASGQIIFEASDGETLQVTIGNADMSEIYQWVPANSLEVVAFVNHIRTLTDQDATITLRDEDADVTDIELAGEIASGASAVTGNLSVTVEDPALLLSAFAVPAGRVAVFAGLIEIEVSGEDVYRPTNNIGSLLDGDLILASDITFHRLRIRGGPRIQLGRAGAGIVSDYLDNNEDGIFHLQDADGVDTQAVSAILAADRLNGGANLRDAGVVSRVDDLITGDRLIVAFTLPAAVTTDIELAGDIASGASAVTGNLSVTVVAGIELAGEIEVGSSITGDLEPLDPQATKDTNWLHYVISIETDPPTRIWTGQGRLNFNGQNHEGAGRLLHVSNIQLETRPSKRVTITLSAIPKAIRAQFLQDVGALKTTIRLIFSKTQGKTWQAAPLSFSGRLSTPNMSDGKLTVEIETLLGDVDHGITLFWSHEDQQSRDPDDLGMEYMRQLSRQGVETGWPP